MFHIDLNILSLITHLNVKCCAWVLNRYQPRFVVFGLTNGCNQTLHLSTQGMDTMFHDTILLLMYSHGICKVWHHLGIHKIIFLLSHGLRTQFHYKEKGLETFKPELLMKLKSTTTKIPHVQNLESIFSNVTGHILAKSIYWKKAPS